MGLGLIIFDIVLAATIIVFLFMCYYSKRKDKDETEEADPALTECLLPKECSHPKTIDCLEIGKKAFLTDISVMSDNQHPQSTNDVNEMSTIDFPNHAKEINTIELPNIAKTGQIERLTGLQDDSLRSNFGDGDIARKENDRDQSYDTKPIACMHIPHKQQRQPTSHKHHHDHRKKPKTHRKHYEHMFDPEEYVLTGMQTIHHEDASCAEQLGLKTRPKLTAPEAKNDLSGRMTVKEMVEAVKRKERNCTRQWNKDSPYLTSRTDCSQNQHDDEIGSHNKNQRSERVHIPKLLSVQQQVRRITGASSTYQGSNHTNSSVSLKDRLNLAHLGTGNNNQLLSLPHEGYTRDMLSHVINDRSQNSQNNLPWQLPQEFKRSSSHSVSSRDSENHIQTPPASTSIPSRSILKYTAPGTQLNRRNSYDIVTLPPRTHDVTRQNIPATSTSPPGSTHGLPEYQRSPRQTQNLHVRFNLPNQPSTSGHSDDEEETGEKPESPFKQKYAEHMKQIKNDRKKPVEKHPLLARRNSITETKTTMEDERPTPTRRIAHVDNILKGQSILLRGNNETGRKTSFRRDSYADNITNQSVSTYAAGQLPNVPTPPDARNLDSDSYAPKYILNNQQDITNQQTNGANTGPSLDPLNKRKASTTIQKMNVAFTNTSLDPQNNRRDNFANQQTSGANGSTPYDVTSKRRESWVNAQGNRTKPGPSRDTQNNKPADMGFQQADETYATDPANSFNYKRRDTGYPHALIADMAVTGHSTPIEQNDTINQQLGLASVPWSSSMDYHRKDMVSPRKRISLNTSPISARNRPDTPYSTFDQQGNVTDMDNSTNNQTDVTNNESTLSFSCTPCDISNNTENKHNMDAAVNKRGDINKQSAVIHAVSSKQTLPGKHMTVACSGMSLPYRTDRSVAFSQRKSYIEASCIGYPVHTRDQAQNSGTNKESNRRTRFERTGSTQSMTQTGTCDYQHVSSPSTMSSTRHHGHTAVRASTPRKYTIDDRCIQPDLKCRVNDNHQCGGGTRNENDTQNANVAPRIPHRTYHISSIQNSRAFQNPHHKYLAQSSVHHINRGAHILLSPSSHASKYTNIQDEMQLAQGPVSIKCSSTPHIRSNDLRTNTNSRREHHHSAQSIPNPVAGRSPPKYDSQVHSKVNVRKTKSTLNSVACGSSPGFCAQARSGVNVSKNQSTAKPIGGGSPPESCAQVDSRTNVSNSSQSDLPLPDIACIHGCDTTTPDTSFTSFEEDIIEDEYNTSSHNNTNYEMMARLNKRRHTIGMSDTQSEDQEEEIHTKTCAPSCNTLVIPAYKPSNTTPAAHKQQYDKCLVLLKTASNHPPFLNLQHQVNSKSNNMDGKDKEANGETTKLKSKEFESESINCERSEADFYERSEADSNALDTEDIAIYCQSSQTYISASKQTEKTCVTTSQTVSPSARHISSHLTCPDSTNKMTNVESVGAHGMDNAKMTVKSDTLVETHANEELHTILETPGNLKSAALEIDTNIKTISEWLLDTAVAVSQSELITPGQEDREHLVSEHNMALIDPDMYKDGATQTNSTADMSPHKSRSCPSSAAVLSKKREAVRNLRKDPELSLLLADIRKRRISGDLSSNNDHSININHDEIQ